MKSRLFMIPLVLVLATSCIVRSPKYTTLEKVMCLEPGMTRAEVESVLRLQPYDLKTRNDTATVFIYVYRLTDRRTFAFNTKEVNGKNAIGQYVKLSVTYSAKGIVTGLESCSQCSDNLVTTSRIDFAKVMVFVTVTLPVLLIYFGLKQ